jgi:hypothetical protein
MQLDYTQIPVPCQPLSVPFLCRYFFADRLTVSLDFLSPSRQIRDNTSNYVNYNFFDIPFNSLFSV